MSAHWENFPIYVHSYSEFFKNSLFKPRESLENHKNVFFQGKMKAIILFLEKIIFSITKFCLFNHLRQMDIYTQVMGNINVCFYCDIKNQKPTCYGFQLSNLGI